MILITSKMLGDADSPSGVGGFRSFFRSLGGSFLLYQDAARRIAAFRKTEGGGNASVSPIRESFDTWPKWKVVLQVLFGVTAGQAVTYYTSHFYALFFLQTVLKVPRTPLIRLLQLQSYRDSGVCDIRPAFRRIGRKRIMMAGIFCRRCRISSSTGRWFRFPSL